MAHLTHDYVGKILTGCKSTAKLLNHKTLASLFCKKVSCFLFSPSWNPQYAKKETHYYILIPYPLQVRHECVSEFVTSPFRVRHVPISEFVPNPSWVRSASLLPPFCLRYASNQRLDKLLKLCKKSLSRTKAERRNSVKTTNIRVKSFKNRAFLLGKNQAYGEKR